MAAVSLKAKCQHLQAALNGEQKPNLIHPNQSHVPFLCIKDKNIQQVLQVRPHIRKN